jgi:hypothetical protein
LIRASVRAQREIELLLRDSLGCIISREPCAQREEEERENQQSHACVCETGGLLCGSGMASLGELYQQAFQSLEAAKQAEAVNSNTPDASQIYLQACQLFRQILRLENDSGKKQLIQSQLQFYEEKIRQLSLLTQLVTEADRIFGQAITLEEKNGNLSQVESLYLQAAEKYCI